MTNLEKLRNKSRLTQGVLANKVGIAISTYSQYETGARNVPLEKAITIARELNCSLEEIFLPIKFTVSKSNEKIKREEVNAE